MMAITHLWRDENHIPPVTGLFVSIPMSYHTPSALPEKYSQRDISYEQNKDAPVFNEITGNFIDSKQPLDPNFPSRYLILILDRLRQARSPRSTSMPITLADRTQQSPANVHGRCGCGSLERFGADL
jgi:hypothetical protein